MQLIRSDPFAARYGPWALIVGGSDGLGAEFARQAARRGINCMLVARNADKLKAVADDIRTRWSVEVKYRSVDLAECDAAARLDAICRGFDVGLVVVNAGGDTVASAFLDSEIDAWQALNRRNVDTLTALCHSFGRRLAIRGSGGLVVVGSDAAFGGGGRLSVYTASKGYALNLVESLWAELKPRGVDAAYVVIGSTDTPKMRGILADRGISPEDIDLADPADIADWTLHHVGDGPMLSYGTDSGSRNPLSSPRIRRERVERTTEIMNMFYGSTDSASED